MLKGWATPCIVIVVFLLYGLYGCGGSNPNGNFTAQGSSSGGNSSAGSSGGSSGNPASSPTLSGETGTVVIDSTLASAARSKARDAVPAGTATFVFTGFDAAGVQIYGPVTTPPAAQTTLTKVPIEVVEIHVAYRSVNDTLLAVSEVPVTVAADQTVTVTATVNNGLTVQLVNDEASVADSDVYVVLTANPPEKKGDQSVSGVAFADFVNNPPTVANPVTAQKLSTLHKTGQTIVSQSTGKALTVYSFTVFNAQGGRFLVSYKTPIVYTSTTDPDAYANFRYDKFEFTYVGATPAASPNPATYGTCYADLTALDFYGVPMQVDAIADSDGTTILQTRTFQASSPTILSQVHGLLSSDATGYAFLSPGPPSAAAPSPSPGGSPVATPRPSPVRGFNSNWTAASPDYSTFLRVLGPQVTSTDPYTCSLPGPTALNYFGRPYPAYPYPSFKGYVGTMVGQCFPVSGLNGVDGLPSTGWSYSASVTATTDLNNPYIITYTPNQPMNVTAPNGPPMGSNSSQNPKDQQLTANLPVTVDLLANQLDEIVYTTPATAFYVPDTCANQPYIANSPYANIANNILAGLQFGYPNGKYGNNGNEWFQVFPVLYPFGAARATNDGLYNAYAAIFYNLSDAYGFTFSDRLPQFNPLLTTQSTGNFAEHTVRITFLNDVRLDAPTGVTVGSATNQSLTVSWKAVTGAKGYVVTVTDGSVPLTYTVGAVTTVTATGLRPGINYTATVRVDNGAGIQSAACYPVPGTTTGAALPLAGANSPFQLQLDWNTSFTAPQSNFKLSINGTATSFGSPVTVQGVGDGLTNNVVPFVVTDTTGAVQDLGNFVVAFKPGAAGAVNLSIMTDGSALVKATPGTTPLVAFMLGPTRVAKVIAPAVYAVASPPVPPAAPCSSPTFTAPSPPANACSPTPTPAIPNCLTITVKAVAPAGSCTGTVSAAAGSIVHFSNPDGSDDAAKALDSTGTAVFTPGQVPDVALVPTKTYTVWISSINANCGPISFAAQGTFGGTGPWSSSVGTHVSYQINIQYGCPSNCASPTPPPLPTPTPSPAPVGPQLPPPPGQPNWGN